MNDWTLNWQGGIQYVVEQRLKLQYYRLYVQPFCLSPDGHPAKQSS